MKISIQLILAVVVLAVGTFVEGKLSDRWGAAQSDKLETFATQLAKVPMQIGDWVGRDDYEYLSDEALAQQQQLRVHLLQLLASPRVERHAAPAHVAHHRRRESESGWCYSK